MVMIFKDRGESDSDVYLTGCFIFTGRQNLLQSMRDLLEWMLKDEEHIRLVYCTLSSEKLYAVKESAIRKGDLDKMRQMIKDD